MDCYAAGFCASRFGHQTTRLRLVSDHDVFRPSVAKLCFTLPRRRRRTRRPMSFCRHLSLMTSSSILSGDRCQPRFMRTPF